MKRIGFGIAILLVLAGAVGYFATRPHGGPAELTGGGPVGAPGGTVIHGPMIPPNPVPSGTPVPAPLLGATRNAVDQQKAIAAPNAPSSVGGSAGVATTTSLGGPAVPSLGPKIVKTADLTVEVKKDGFQQAFGQASLVAAKYNGFVVDSSTLGSKARSGSLLVRVPAQSFDQAMKDFSSLGTVDGESVHGQDVTSNFIDLSARLKTWQAQERVLFRLMNKAHSISETMNVQRELQQVQFNIEDIQGQLRELRNKTSLATISLTIHEPGVAVGPRPTPKPSLARAWSKALAGFLSVIYAVLVGLGYLLPVGAIGGLVWLGYRRVSRGHPSPART